MTSAQLQFQVVKSLFLNFGLRILRMLNKNLMMVVSIFVWLLQPKFVINWEMIYCLVFRRLLVSFPGPCHYLVLYYMSVAIRRNCGTAIKFVDGAPKRRQIIDICASSASCNLSYKSLIVQHWRFVAGTPIYNSASDVFNCWLYPMQIASFFIVKF